MALPAPSTLTATTRYFVAGTRRYTWVPTIAAKATPTSAELGAGTDLTGEVVAGSVNGFNTSSDQLDVPDAGGRFTGKIPARITSDDSAMTFYASTNGTDVRSLLTQDLNGYVVIYPEGIVASGKCHVFPVRVASQSDEQDTEDSGKITVNFAVTSAPVRNITIPTA
jgi:hypothetical protein